MSVWAVGHYAALFVTMPIERAAAEKMIPAGLELAPQNLTGAGEHPLLMMFGHHTDVHPSFLPIRGWSYHEFLVAIPWVRRRGVEEVDSTMPKLYLDNCPMVLAGWIYGFPKVRARIDASGNEYAVRSLFGGRRVIEARWTDGGTSGHISDFPNAAAVEPTFRQPFIQRFPPLPFERSVMTFDLDTAVIQSAVAEVTITQSFLPGLPTGPRTFPAIAETPLGAFTIQVPWTLSPPKFLL